MSVTLKFRLILLSACLAAGGYAQAGETATAHDRLHELFAEYREASLELNPLNAMFEGDYRYNDRLGDYISPEYQRRSEALERKFIKALDAMDAAGLSREDHLSYDIFRYSRETALEAFRNGCARMDSLMPVSQFFSLPTFVAQLGGGTSAQPFNTVEDYDNWLKRAGDFPGWVDQAIRNLKQGIEEGVVLPRVIVEKAIPQIAAHVVDDVEESVFIMPVQNFPDAIGSADRETLAAAYRDAIEHVLVPAYRKLHQFLSQEYLPQARDTVGLGHLPGGPECYAYLARYHTTTSLSPEEIHRIGREEAERIFRDMKAVKAEVQLEGDMHEFFTYLRTEPRFYHDSADALLESYRELSKTVDARVPRLFDLTPRAEFVIRPIEKFREQSAAAAEYLPPAPDGSRPGIFYVNTYDLEARPIWEREALYVHEAIPGHHYQISIAQEQEHLPKFQRFDGPTAYSEGWGLYAETLGYDLGLYQDPWQRMGALNLQIWRANRLVVDTGMHALGWTRQQALEWMRSNSPVPETDAIAEVERYVAIPGQALAYKIGQLRMTALRERAQAALGDKFDIRGFHREMLISGAMPLALLEQKIDRWIAAQSGGAAAAH